MVLKIWSQVGELDYNFQIYHFHMSGPSYPRFPRHIASQVSELLPLDSYAQATTAAQVTISP